MYFRILIAIVVLTANITAVPVPEYYKNDAILRQVNYPYADGKYKFGFETKSGILQEQVGILKTDSQGTPYLATYGSYSYTGPDNQVYKVSYVADDKGYRVLPPNVENEVTIDDFIVFPDGQPESPGGSQKPEEENTENPTPAAAKSAIDLDDLGEEGVGNRNFPPDIIGSLIGGR